MTEPYDCPTGRCGATEDPPCRSVKLGDKIDPNSRAHLERNACNRCPNTPPRPVYIEKLNMRTGMTFKVLDRWVDHEGNTWEPDNAATAWWFHDDPVPGFRDEKNMTFRVARVASGAGRGWQCRYVGGKLDDTTKYMGTYDYAPAPSAARAVGNMIAPGTVENLHNAMDVAPHKVNGNYLPNLTQRY
ncbi:hypothetical protein [uncultured Paracoccus sp.]|uniref:hypothetical protein n=1 Tax=uncultured Paracoccus sp. TaxID=189685 RepID=UPI002613BDC2|nr:hypothetical protein [uncultured Paracoccus sp.]